MWIRTQVQVAIGIQPEEISSDPSLKALKKWCLPFAADSIICNPGLFEKKTSQFNFKEKLAQKKKRENWEMRLQEVEE